MKSYTWWWQAKNTKTFSNWWSCETWTFIKLIYNVVFLFIQLCLLFVVGDSFCSLFFKREFAMSRHWCYFMYSLVCDSWGGFVAFMGVHWLLNAIYGVKITKMWWEGLKWKWIVGWGNGFGVAKHCFLKTFGGNWFSFFMYNVDSNSLCLGREFF
jgi:hypothetical protein